MEPYKKKRKLDPTNRDNVNTSKPSAVYQPTGGRDWTISVAIPGSIIGNALTHDLKTTLAGQIARACSVFSVDEVVIFDDGWQARPKTNPDPRNGNDARREELRAKDEENGYTAFADPTHFLFHVLGFLETPPYLRRTLFPHHPNLRTAGALPSLDMPHHLRAGEWCMYREGVTVRTEDEARYQPQARRPGNTADGLNAQKPRSKKTKFDDDTPQQTQDSETNGNTNTIYVNAGLQQPVIVSTADPIPPKTRVTLQLPEEALEDSVSAIEANPVPPDSPRVDSGYYWGYSVRTASSLSAVFEECPFEGGYDFSIGTSERGLPLSSLPDSPEHPAMRRLPKWNHLMVAFGGVAGLEQALRHDEKLQDAGVKHVREAFDQWINVVEHGQGSRTIRTEEAVWIALGGLQRFINATDSMRASS